MKFNGCADNCGETVHHLQAVKVLSYYYYFTKLRGGSRNSAKGGGGGGGGLRLNSRRGARGRALPVAGSGSTASRFFSFPFIWHEIKALFTMILHVPKQINTDGIKYITFGIATLKKGFINKSLRG